MICPFENFCCADIHILVKKYLQQHWHQFENTEFPELELLEACMAAVTPEKAEAWFKDCGYM